MSLLSEVRTGIRPAPDRVMLVGVEGVGKSTFGASAPNPVFIAPEDGVRHLDVASFPEPKAFSDVMAAVAALTSEPHSFETCVIDTLDWLEPLVWADICQKRGWLDREGKPDIEKPGYGKGYVAANDLWRSLLGALDGLRNARGVEIILIAHAAIKTFSNPTGADFSRYEPKLQRGASALCKEWADAVLFATYEDFVREEKGMTKAKGVSTGRRVIHTTRNAAWDAKNRHNLPEELPLSYEDYAEARTAGVPASAEALLDEARSLFGLIPEEKREAVRRVIDERKDNALALSKVVDRMRSLVAEAN